MSESTAFLIYVLVPGALSLSIYWYFYTAFIDRLRSKHPAMFSSLGGPTELDSNISDSNRKLWAFVLGFEFRALQDRRLSFFGFGLVLTACLAIGTGLFCIAAWNANH